MKMTKNVNACGGFVTKVLFNGNGISRALNFAVVADAVDDFLTY